MPASSSARSSSRPAGPTKGRPCRSSSLPGCSPTGFRFAAKGSRYLTHMKRLLDPGPGIDRYFERVDRLGRKLAVVLWQLPPQMNKADLPRLEKFLRKLPHRVRYAVEFRSES